MTFLRKTLNLLGKIIPHRGGFWRFATIAGAAIALTGCISSTGPVLSDAKPVLGERGLIHAYTLSQGAAHDPEVVSFQWSGSRYLVRGKSIGYSEFTAHPYEGRDWIVQGTTQRAPHRIEYGLARKLAEGVYQLVAIDENDAAGAGPREILHQDAGCLLPHRDARAAVRFRARERRQADGGRRPRGRGRRRQRRQAVRS